MQIIPPIRAGRRLASLCLAAALLSACSDDRQPTDEVAGTWALEDDAGGAVYLRIGADSIHVYTQDGLDDCFDLDAYAIDDVDGDRFRLSRGEEERTIFLRRDDDDLILEVADQPERYVATSLDPSTLLMCEGPSTGADCASLPALVVDQTMTGSIEGSDEMNPDGTHYDLYRLTGPGDVHVEMESAEIDSYLVLFDSAGVFLAQNDDASNLTLNARLSPSLESGCHIVMATTAFAEDFGEYDISLSTPN